MPIDGLSMNNTMLAYASPTSSSNSMLDELNIDNSTEEGIDLKLLDESAAELGRGEAGILNFIQGADSAGNKNGFVDEAEYQNALTVNFERNNEGVLNVFGTEQDYRTQMSGLYSDFIDVQSTLPRPAIDSNGIVLDRIGNDSLREELIKNDTDKDGVLSRPEYGAMLDKGSLRGKHLMNALHRYDDLEQATSRPVPTIAASEQPEQKAEGNNMQSKPETVADLNSLPQGINEQVLSTLREADKDGNDKVTRGEMAEYLASKGAEGNQLENMLTAFDQQFQAQPTQPTPAQSKPTAEATAPAQPAATTATAPANSSGGEGVVHLDKIPASAAQDQGLIDLFKAADMNGDGIVKRKEFGAYLTDKLGADATGLQGGLAAFDRFVNKLNTAQPDSPEQAQAVPAANQPQTNPTAPAEGPQRMTVQIGGEDDAATIYDFAKQQLADAGKDTSHDNVAKLAQIYMAMNPTIDPRAMYNTEIQVFANLDGFGLKDALPESVTSRWDAHLNNQGPLSNGQAINILELINLQQQQPAAPEGSVPVSVPVSAPPAVAPAPEAPVPVIPAGTSGPGTFDQEPLDVSNTSVTPVPAGLSIDNGAPEIPQELPAAPVGNTSEPEENPEGGDKQQAPVPALW